MSGRAEHEVQGPSPDSFGEELAHFLTHGGGLVASVGALVGLVVLSSLHGDVRHLIGCSVFGATLVFLYAASTLHHGIPGRRSRPVFQQLDHAAIYLLIAGTYTPFSLVTLQGSLGFALLAIVWGLAGLGIALQLWLPERSRRLRVPLYLAMGWLIVIAIEPLTRALPPDGLALLILGGLAYTVGVIFYAWRRLPYNHAVWHVFVLAGSACHLSCVLAYVIPSTG